MLVYLYGLDSYRRHNKLKEIIAVYKKKHSGLSLERFYLEEDGSFERLKNFAVSQSLFDHSKLGIVNGLSSDTKEAPKFLKSLVEIQNLTLIIVSDKALGKDFRFLLEKPSLSQSFEKLEGAHLAAFIKKEAEVRGVKINSEEAVSLARSNNGDTWGIINDLEKISLGGQLEYAGEAPQFWPLLMVIKGNQPALKKISALTRLFEVEDASMIFNILASQVGGAMKNKMADLDPAIKQGKIGYEEALLSIVTSD